MIDDLDESAVLTTRDVEKLLKIPRQTQIDLRARGGFIPHFFAGHKVLYTKDAARRWIAEAEAKSAGDPGTRGNGNGCGGKGRAGGGADGRWRADEG
jgi:hypothetical protein